MMNWFTSWFHDAQKRAIEPAHVDEPVANYFIDGPLHGNLLEHLFGDKAPIAKEGLTIVTPPYKKHDGTTTPPQFYMFKRFDIECYPKKVVSVCLPVHPCSFDEDGNLKHRITMDDNGRVFISHEPPR